jgi:hypothetical protein
MSVKHTSRALRPIKALVLAAMLLAPAATLAASPEDAYLAARDRYIATFKKPAKDETKLYAQNEKALKELEQQLKPIVGPFAAQGFAAEGKINLDSLFPEDEGFGMLDGLVYGETESDKSVVVTTDSLFDKWLLTHRDLWAKDANTPIAAAGEAAVKTEDFYARAVNTDSAVAHYAELPVVAPTGAKFTHATLSLMGNGPLVPGAPDRIYVALEQNGRVFIVDEKLDVPVPPIPACDGAGADYTKKAEATDKVFMDGGGKNKKLLDAVEKLHSQADHAVCACFADKVKGAPAYNAAVAQAAAVVAALTGK